MGAVFEKYQFKKGVDFQKFQYKKTQSSPTLEILSMCVTTWIYVQTKGIQSYFQYFGRFSILRIVDFKGKTYIF